MGRVCVCNDVHSKEGILCSYINTANLKKGLQGMRKENTEKVDVSYLLGILRFGPKSLSGLGSWSTLL